MKSDETAHDLPEVVTSQLPVLRDAHLEEAEFLDFSRHLLEPEAHDLPDGKHNFVMELLEGLPLDALLHEKGG